MKRFLTVTALTALMASSAYAASPAETAAINRYLPDVNVESLSDSQVTELFALSNTSKPDAQKRTSMQAVIEGQNVNHTFSPEQIALIERYLPADRVAAMTGPEKAQALTTINAGSSRSKIEEQLSVIGNKTVAPLSQTELAQLRIYAPDANFSTLSKSQIGDLRAALYSDQSDANIQYRVQEIVS